MKAGKGNEKLFSNSQHFQDAKSWFPNRVLLIPKDKAQSNGHAKYLEYPTLVTEPQVEISGISKLLFQYKATLQHHTINLRNIHKD